MLKGRGRPARGEAVIPDIVARISGTDIGGRIAHLDPAAVFRG
jgi:hypothetical protein